MKIKLIHKEIDLDEIATITRKEENVARLVMHTGEIIFVRCGVRSPRGLSVCYRGSFEELKLFIDRYKSANPPMRPREF